MTDALRERQRELDDLLLREATETLPDADQRRLEELLAQFPDVDRYGYEASVAAVLLAALAPAEPMPDSLAQRLSASARDWRSDDR